MCYVLSGGLLTLVLTKRDRNSFDSKQLVFIASPDRMWVSHRNCVWDAPASLKQAIKASNWYSDCSNLFCNHLGVRAADICDVVFELCSLLIFDQQEDVILRCQDILMTLVQFLSEGAELDANAVLQIQNAKVFPVVEVSVDCQTDDSETSGFRSISDQDWYIADRMTLGNAFKGRHNLLRFSTQTIQKLQPFFERLRCCDKYLSAAVKETIETRGDPVHDPVREHEICTRKRYISAYMTLAHFFLQSANNLVTD